MLRRPAGKLAGVGASSQPPFSLEPLRLQENPAPDEREVLRLLGYREGSMRLEAPMRSVLSDARARALPLLRGAVDVAICSNPQALGAGELFARAELVLVGVATIGAALEEEAESLVAQGAWTLGLVLDAYGSAAAERLVIEANARICKEAERVGLRAGRRISPGYAGWPLPAQHALFAALGAATAGVQLLESAIMTPRKSVSFAVPLGRDLDSESPELGCRFCDMPNCEYRRRPREENL